MTDRSPKAVDRSAPLAASRLRSLLIKVGLVLGSIVVALLTGELAIRLFGLDPAARPIPSSALAAHALKASARQYAPALGGRGFVEIHTNSHAMRDWEHPGNERVRILGVGDSFSFGYGVELEEAYLSVAERALWERSPTANIAVYKLGFPGVSQEVELEALRAHWNEIRPHVVVLGFSEDTDIDENIVQNPMLLRLAKGDDPDLPPGVVASDFLRRRSALVRYFKARKLRGQISKEARALLDIVHAWGGARIDFDALTRSGWQRRFIDSFGDKLDLEWQFTEQLLDQIRAFVEGNGAKLVLFRIPSRSAVEPDAWEVAVQSVCGKTPAEVAATCGRVDPEHTAKRLHAYADLHHLLYVDPAQTLKSFIVAGERLYFEPPEIHWTRRGHERAGRFLAAALGDSLKLAQPVEEMLPNKPRRFGALWVPGGERPSSWLDELRGDSEHELSQTLLWAEEARIDFLVFPVHERGELDGQTQSMIKRLLTERRNRMRELGFAFQIDAQTGGADLGSRLDALLEQQIAPAGAAYAHACGRPILFTNGNLKDARFTFVRGVSSKVASLSAPAGCDASEPPVGDASCQEAREVDWLCTVAIAAGRSFLGDPDLLVASSFDGPGFNRLQPTPGDGRLMLALTDDAVGRWKRRQDDNRRPSFDALSLFRSWLPLRVRPLVLKMRLPITHDYVSCRGCWPVEERDGESFAWTTGDAELVVSGVVPGRKYRITLFVIEDGGAPLITFKSGDGRTEAIELRDGNATWPTLQSARADGTLAFRAIVEPWRPTDRGGSDPRQLGIAISAVRIDEVPQ